MSVQRSQRGMAMVVVLSMVVVLGAIVAFAIIVSGQEARNTGRLVHNMTLQEQTEATLQFGRNYFANNYGVNGATWNMYLAYFVANPVILTATPPTTTSAQIASALAKLRTAVLTLPDGTTISGAVLINPNTSAGTTCYIYCHDNVDELPPKANDPTKDNDLLIYVGAVCVQQIQGGNTGSEPLVAEIVAPLLFNPSQYANQAAGGTQGLNNASILPGFR